MNGSAMDAGKVGEYHALHMVAGLDPKNGGPSYSVPRLCGALRAANCTAKILTVQEEKTPTEQDVESFPQDGTGLPLLGGLRFSGGLHRAIHGAARTADVVHAHGLWLMPNVYVGWAAARAGKPLIVSPRGMLSPSALAYSRWRKALFWGLLQRPAYARIACWHATSQQEAEEVRAFGIRAPIAVIPNGMDLPPLRPPDRGSTPHHTILYLGRLHPKKGLDRLIEAWSVVAAERPNWRLRIVGPDEGGHRTELEARLGRLQTPRVSFEGPLYAEAKDEAFRDANVFVLPTRSENFGLTVAEALGAGTPAIVTKGAPWSGLETHGCGWWIEQGVPPLVEALRAATALPDRERRIMGARGREWVEEAFAWEGVAERMMELYAWVTDRGPEPDFLFSA